MNSLSSSICRVSTGPASALCFWPPTWSSWTTLSSSRTRDFAISSVSPTLFEIDYIIRIFLGNFDITINLSISISYLQFLSVLFISNRLKQVPTVKSSQLSLGQQSVQHVTFSSDELLQRCVLPNRHVALRVREPATRTSHASASSQQSKPTVTFDLGQILLDIEDAYLKNKARISYMVSSNSLIILILIILYKHEYLKYPYSFCIGPYGKI